MNHGIQQRLLRVELRQCRALVYHTFGTVALFDARVVNQLHEHFQVLLAAGHICGEDHAGEAFAEEFEVVAGQVAQVVVFFAVQEGEGLGCVEILLNSQITIPYGPL